jgi:hypothetical protein
MNVLLSRPASPDSALVHDLPQPASAEKRALG